MNNEKYIPYHLKDDPDFMASMEKADFERRQEKEEPNEITNMEEEICEICGEPLSETQNNKHNHENTENSLGE